MVKRERNHETLEQRVLNFIRDHHLISGQQTLLVAVSGGPDSVCLLHLLFNLHRELGIVLHAAHLNHQLRGTESDADARYVSDLAHQLGIPATIEGHDVKSYQIQHHISLEEAAREVRYDFLAKVAKSAGASQVAVGHTIDDHIETILLHMIRGTGINGLRGLQPRTEWRLKGDKNSVTVIRPLLRVRREETATYCHDHKLSPRLDASNLSLSLLRNRVRHQLLPELRSYNPQIADALLRTAQIAKDDLAFLDSEAARLWIQIVQEQEDRIILDKGSFLELPPALKRHLLRTAIEKLLGTLKDIETRHIDGIMAVLTKPAGRRISLPGGLVFTIDYDRYFLAPETAPLSPFPALEGEFPLNLPGETSLPGWHVAATVASREQMAEKNDNFTAFLDFDETGDKLVARSRASGDRFQPLGLSQPKKLGEFMIDARIPRAWRQRIPVVCSPKQIVWVAGWRIDERVKVTSNTSRILRLKFERS